MVTVDNHVITHIYQDIFVGIIITGSVFANRKLSPVCIGYI